VPQIIDLEKAKLNAANAALEHVKDGMVLGIGTGSTVAHFIKLLGKRKRSEKLKLEVVPTSHQSALLLIEQGFKIASLDEYPELDLAIDGADEVDASLNLVKGGGAALAREKIVMCSAKEVVIIVDHTKLVTALGEKNPIPVEVLPFAWRVVSKRLEKLGGVPKLRDAGKAKDGPVVTDNGNFILDVSFPPIQQPSKLEQEIKAIPGVVEVGIFTNLTRLAYVGYESGVKKLTKTT